MSQSLLTMPSHSGWMVEYESDEVSKRTGKRLWREVLVTTNKQKANERIAELQKEGKNARLLECIF